MRLTAALILVVAAGGQHVLQAQDAPVTFARLNEALGLPLFQDDNVWDDADTDAGQRLHWPQESRTRFVSSYRLYPPPHLQTFGAHPYSLALYAENGKPVEFSLIFANRGDFPEFKDFNEPDRRADEKTSAKAGQQREKEQAEAVAKFKETLKADTETIAALLTKTLGTEPVEQIFGVGSEMRKGVKRWDWNGHAFLLSAPREQYVGLRILPTATADNEGRVDHMDSMTLEQHLQECVIRRGNGDVLVDQIPMVDQGPKGYCVPATWERYLRYLGVPADMYALAMAGGTDFGGGTSVYAMTDSVSGLVRGYGRRIEDFRGDLNIKTLSRYIDRGLPVMWQCWVSIPLERSLFSRIKSRPVDGTMETWKTKIQEYRSGATGLHYNPDTNGLHMRLIIGYNADTGEVAISDSWGEDCRERWMTEEELYATDKGGLKIVKW